MLFAYVKGTENREVRGITERFSLAGEELRTDFPVVGPKRSVESRFTFCLFLFLRVVPPTSVDEKQLAMDHRTC